MICSIKKKSASNEEPASNASQNREQVLTPGLIDAGFDPDDFSIWLLDASSDKNQEDPSLKRKRDTEKSKRKSLCSKGDYSEFNNIYPDFDDKGYQGLKWEQAFPERMLSREKILSGICTSIIKLTSPNKKNRVINIEERLNRFGNVKETVEQFLKNPEKGKYLNLEKENIFVDFFNAINKGSYGFVGKKPPKVQLQDNDKAQESLDIFALFCALAKCGVLKLFIQDNKEKYHILPENMHDILSKCDSIYKALFTKKQAFGNEEATRKGAITNPRSVFTDPGFLLDSVGYNRGITGADCFPTP